MTDIVERRRRTGEWGQDGMKLEAADEIEALRNPWQPMEKAPKGGGADLVTDPNWVEPPEILLLFEDGERRVGVWDWYYAEGGRGYEGLDAWIEPTSGELLVKYYDQPIRWMPLPAPPQETPNRIAAAIRSTD